MAGSYPGKETRLRKKEVWVKKAIILILYIRYFLQIGMMFVWSFWSTSLIFSINACKSKLVMNWILKTSISSTSTAARFTRERKRNTEHPEVTLQFVSLHNRPHQCSLCWTTLFSPTLAKSKTIGLKLFGKLQSLGEACTSAMNPKRRHVSFLYLTNR